MILVLALVTATFQPAQPKVGDLITVTFPAPVVLEPSPEYELVRRDRARVVVRTFEPRPFELRGTMNGVRFEGVRIPVGSVLRQGDDLVPAPLAAPRPLPQPRLPLLAIGAAALAALAAWALAWWRSRASAVDERAPVRRPEERFRDALLALRADPSRRLRWAALANETRAYLDATRPNLSDDLTTAELLPRLRAEERVVEEILRQGDLEKFSQRGAVERDFEEMVTRALALAERGDGLQPVAGGGRGEARPAS